MSSNSLALCLSFLELVSSAVSAFMYSSDALDAVSSNSLWSKTLQKWMEDFRDSIVTGLQQDRLGSRLLIINYFAFFYTCTSNCLYGLVNFKWCGNYLAIWNKDTLTAMHVGLSSWCFEHGFPSEQSKNELAHRFSDTKQKLMSLNLGMLLVRSQRVGKFLNWYIYVSLTFWWHMHKVKTTHLTKPVFNFFLLSTTQNT